MFFFRKKKVADPNPTPSWTKWLLIGFAVFVVLLNLAHGTRNTPVKEALDKAKTDAGKLINFSAYKQQIFPEYAAALRFNEVKPGTGNPAVCGQEVKIAYNGFFTDDKPLSDSAGKDQPLTFRIGEGKVMPALEQGATGMKPGGERSLIASSTMAYGAPGHTRADVPANATVRFEVTLLGAQPPLPDMATTPYRVSTVINGRGAPIRCGEKANVHVTIWSVEGKKLFPKEGTDNALVSFTPGLSEVFLGLEQGVLGMAKGGARTLVVPPVLQKTLTGAKPAIDFPFPEHQTVLVDIEAMP